MSEAKISMKLLIDNTKRKVLFAEAEKECVDFLFHILSLPLGTVVGYLTKESMVGSLGSLYGSLESLSANYVQPGLNKDCLLKPKTAVGAALNIPLLTNNPAPALIGGYVKGLVSYMIMDDLTVQPMSMVSSIALLNKFNVRDVGGLEEREVTLDINLGIALLKASLMSKTVLTDVFVGTKAADVN